MASGCFWLSLEAPVMIAERLRLFICLLFLTVTPHTCMQVVLLGLEHNQLSGTVPYLPNLQVLNVSSNLLTEPRFDAMPATLQFLYLSNNRLTGELLQLGRLTSGPKDLRLLDLAYNNLSGSLPQDMPISLSIVNISNNAFGGTLPSNWSKLKMASLKLDNNKFTGTLPPAWSAWGSNTDNSIQLSVRNTSLRGSMPRQWVEQFCLAIVEFKDAQVLFEPSNVSPIEGITTMGISFSLMSLKFGPLIQLPPQQASINVTLASKVYSFDYNNPDSVCGIEDAFRNTVLLWCVFIAVLIFTFLSTIVWLTYKPSPQGGLFSTILMHDKLHSARQVGHRIWFFVSDVFWTYYSQVTDAITIHQVFSSNRVDYARGLLAILLLPFLIMFLLVARVSIKRCQENIGCGTPMRWAAALFTGLLLAPIVSVALEFLIIFHGIGVPLPWWWGSLGIDLATFYRTQSVVEAFVNALPQSIVQTKLYLMGNDPNGTRIYIDTRLFMLSAIGSLFSVLTTVVFIAVELHQYGHSLSGYTTRPHLFLDTFTGYCLKLLKFESFP